MWVAVGHRGDANGDGFGWQSKLRPDPPQQQAIIRFYSRRYHDPKTPHDNEHTWTIL